MVPEILTDAGFDEALEMLSDAFGEAPHPAQRDVERSIVDPERMLVVRDAGETVATSGAFALEMSVPGSTLDIAGITWVGVRGTHRRRGLLTTMMTRLLHDAHERGEAVAALHASQAAIYPRFGFAPSAWGVSVAVPSGAGLLRETTSDVRRVAPTGEALDATYEQVRARTPGLVARDGAWWQYRLDDPAYARRGASPLRCAVTEGGYALYATKPAFPDGVADGTVTVRELMAVDDDARLRLWRYLLSLDLMARVKARVAADDPLLTLLAEPRAAAPRLTDLLWTRPVSIGAALSGRRYPVPVDVVLAVTDELCPWNDGAWRLTGGPEGASCALTRESPDLTLTVGDLGAAYLGGTPLRMGRGRGVPVVEHTHGALAAVGAAFGPVDTGPFSAQTW